MGTLIQEMPPTILKVHDAHSRPLTIDTATANLRAPPIGHLSHSPLESPPILKKRLRRLGSSLLAGTLNVRDLPPELMAVLKHQDSSPQTTRSLLSQNGRSKMAGSNTLARASSCPPRHRVNSMSSSQEKAGSILKGDTRRSLRVPSSPGKRVQFESNVTVHLMDEEGHICTQCEQLQIFPRQSRRDFIARNIRRQRNFPAPSHNSPSPSTPTTDFHTNNIYRRGDGDQDLSPDMNMSSNVYTGPRPVLNQDNVNPSNINITFEQDADKGTKLKFVVYLGLDYQPENVVVKANMNGNRIRVLATVEQSGEEFNQRYLLPMNVDPFSVEARLDTKGYLTVVAPLMTNARRQELSHKDKPAAS
nr:small heat shock protein [Flabelliderma ockeri]